jgi:hypothetical protein
VSKGRFVFEGGDSYKGGHYISKAHVPFLIRTSASWNFLLFLLLPPPPRQFIEKLIALLQHKNARWEPQEPFIYNYACLSFSVLPEASTMLGQLVASRGE